MPWWRDDLWHWGSESNLLPTSIRTRITNCMIWHVGVRNWYISGSCILHSSCWIHTVSYIYIYICSFIYTEVYTWSLCCMPKSPCFFCFRKFCLSSPHNRSRSKHWPTLEESSWKERLAVTWLGEGSIPDEQRHGRMELGVWVPKGWCLMFAIQHSMKHFKPCTFDCWSFVSSCWETTRNRTRRYWGSSWWKASKHPFHCHADEGPGCLKQLLRLCQGERFRPAQRKEAAETSTQGARPYQTWNSLESTCLLYEEWIHQAVR